MILLSIAQAARPPVAGPGLVSPLILDGEQRETLWVFPNADPTRFLIEAKPLLDLTEPILLEDRQQRLRQSIIEDKGVISVSLLEAQGLKAHFDEIALEFKLEIPASIRRQGELELAPRPIFNGVRANPAAFSGYFNLRGSQGYTYPSSGAQRARDPFLGGVDSVINFQKWVLESGVDYTERSAPPWARRDLRLVRDDPSHMLRYTVGDLQVPTFGYQVSRPQGGVSVVRDFTLQPYLNNRPLSRSEVLIRRPSTVDIYINGAFFARHRLAPGPFDFRDYPLLAGVNSVEIKITDDLGQVETINLSFVNDFQLLAPGLHQFGYALAEPSESNGFARKYDPKKPTGTLFHRVGLSNVVTAGVNAQGDPRQKLVGVEAGWATLIGFWSADSGLSWNRYSRQGNASRLRFRSIDRWNGRDLTTRLNLEGEYRSLDFSTLGTDSPSNPYGWSLDSYVVQTLPASLYAGVGFREQWNRVGGMDRQTYRADLTKSWSPAWRTSINYTATKPGGPDGSSGPTDHRVLFTLTWNDLTGRYNATASHDTFDERTRLDFARTNEKPYDDYRLQGGVGNSPRDREADLQAEYLAHRGTARLLHQTTEHRQDSRTDNHTVLSAGTAVAWAGGDVGITRPINDSFVMLAADDRPPGVKIPVNPNGQYSETELTGWGPGILPSVTGYYQQPISIDDSVLPQGYLPRESFYVAYPTYRSGTLIELKINRVISVQGQLLDPAGKPLALETGDVLGPGLEGDGISFFTNRNGQFLIEGLKPGRYELRVFSGKWRPVPLVLTAGSPPGLQKVPALTVQPVQEGK